MCTRSDGAYVTEPRNPEAELPVVIRRARAGDPRAFEALVAAYRGRIYRWALVRIGDRDDAEDATQEALVRLHRGLREYTGRGSFETWLYSVVRSASADAQRRRARSQRLKDRLASLVVFPSATDSPSVVEGLETRRIGELVRAFLEDLPARQREALYLVDLEGLGQAEAAARMGVGHATLRTHLFRARRAIRTRLLAAGPGTEETE